MALTALSLAPREGISTMDALQHYEQALIPLQNNLRTSQDLAANGPFLTHYVLLLYEVGTGLHKVESSLTHVIDCCLRTYGIESVVPTFDSFIANNTH